MLPTYFFLWIFEISCFKMFLRDCFVGIYRFFMQVLPTSILIMQTNWQYATLIPILQVYNMPIVWYSNIAILQYYNIPILILQLQFLKIHHLYILIFLISWKIYMISEAHLGSSRTLNMSKTINGWVFMNAYLCEHYSSSQ